MNKLIVGLVVFAFVCSSNSEILDNGFGLKGAAQRFRDDENFIVNGDFTLPNLWFAGW